jgi:hypothetical protein
MVFALGMATLFAGSIDPASFTPSAMVIDGTEILTVEATPSSEDALICVKKNAQGDVRVCMFCKCEDLTIPDSPLDEEAP